MNDDGEVFRDRSVDARTGDEPIDEFVHDPLTLPALRRVAIILNGGAAENKRLACDSAAIRTARCVGATPARLPFADGQPRAPAL
jgi:hypothetical protein